MSDQTLVRGAGMTAVSMTVLVVTGDDMLV